MPVSVDLPEELRKDLEDKKDEGYYSSTSEIIREALREFLEETREVTEKQRIVAELADRGEIEKIEVSGEAAESLDRGLEQLEEER